MSAFVVNKRHIDYLVGAAVELGLVTGLVTENGACTFGQKLWDENRRSVDYRYGDQPEEIVYTFTPVTRPPFSCAQTIQAVRCLEYQSCEHWGWKASEAHHLLAQLAEAAEKRARERPEPRADVLAWEIR